MKTKYESHLAVSCCMTRTCRNCSSLQDLLHSWFLIAAMMAVEDDLGFLTKMNFHVSLTYT